MRGKNTQEKNNLSLWGCYFSVPGDLVVWQSDLCDPDSFIKTENAAVTMLQIHHSHSSLPQRKTMDAEWLIYQDVTHWFMDKSENKCAKFLFTRWRNDSCAFAHVIPAFESIHRGLQIYPESLSFFTFCHNHKNCCILSGFSVIDRKWCRSVKRDWKNILISQNKSLESLLLIFFLSCLT